MNTAGYFIPQKHHFEGKIFSELHDTTRIHDSRPVGSGLQQLLLRETWTIRLRLHQPWTRFCIWGKKTISLLLSEECRSQSHLPQTNPRKTILEKPSNRISCTLRSGTKWHFEDTEAEEQISARTLEKLTREKRWEMMGKNWGKRNRENTPISIWAYTSPTPFPHSPALKLFPIIGQIIKAHSHLGNSRELQGEGGVTHNTPNWVRLNFIPLCHLFLWTKMSLESPYCSKTSGPRGRAGLLTGLRSIRSPREKLLTDGPQHGFK